MLFISQYIFAHASQVTIVVKNPPANAEDIRGVDLAPGLGRSPGEGNIFIFCSVLLLSSLLVFK